MKRSIALAALSVSVFLSLVSCNTSRGFGQDLQKVGEEIEEQANETYGSP
jgi:predicted small secreted protein